MSYGFFHCLDSFLFIFTFLPLRVSWWWEVELSSGAARCSSPPAPSSSGPRSSTSASSRQYYPPWPCSLQPILMALRNTGRLLRPAEIIDLLKCFIIGGRWWWFKYRIRER